ncbi:hypothetical protein [Aureivirga sp. CE67]|uniref:hypothetical protein n=1 Tax=Aureivirga sp. CE67 TaxID=1788983 RepID=UPI0018C8F424|nr:hypothetical protein [Aureivirga sp. CE67]
MYEVKHLIIALERCEMAASHFESNQKIFQGMRLKKAYKKLIEIIEYNFHYSQDVDREKLMNLLFFAEDWIHNFDNEIKKLDSENIDVVVKLPVFENAIQYPTEYIDSLKTEFEAPGWHHDEPRW